MSEPQLNTGRTPRLILPKPSPLYAAQSKYVAENRPLTAKYSAEDLELHLVEKKDEIHAMLREEDVGDPWERLREYLQTGIMIELSTIPPYLYAYYSCKSSGDAAARAIRKIVIEEMVHLVLAGNILLFSGGAPSLYLDHNFPIYPWEIEAIGDSSGGLKLNLRRLDEEARENFIKIEQPAPERDPDFGKDDVPPRHPSIGTFYADLQRMISGFSPPFVPWPGEVFQISKADGNWARNAKTIGTFDDADKALKIIIEQGEGAAPGDKNSHYEIFKAMKPPGEQGTHNVGLNPHTKDYKDPNVHAVSTLFDASYCYLLLSIEALWRTPLEPEEKRKGLAENVDRIMRPILERLAKWLVQHFIEEGSQQLAAPCFEFYDYREGGVVCDALGKLRELLKKVPKEVREALESDFEELTALETA